ncbi:membrane protein [Clostridium carboxidivorans P7]|uniref:Membrane protein n=1 Tax=Clostridium carboxidivorans P7 TaxID=536227 RepID=C6PN04_9CLOT|nr:hypothetical protein [Clostridium carboxidivorans]AKN30889.1 membrane protein [Clostridium carboxidivorans P7]EET89337.1 membrane protein [Clostridium carboxidivorans P7]EFG88863.1 membrane family protein [Clostridium carboxidivorans P7]
MKFNAIGCFAIVMAFLFIGEAVSTKTKAYVPSVFLSAVLFMIGFWTFVPKDVVNQASFGPNFVSVCMSLLLVHLGTLMSLKKLIEQWKAVLIAVCGICGTVLLTMTIGRIFFDWHVVVAATPPLTGGIVAALLMSEALKAKGLMALAALPIAMFITHSFFGYPLTSWCLKREGKRLLEDFRKNGANETELKNSKQLAEKSVCKKLIPPVPENYRTTSLILFKVMLVAILASWVSGLTHGAVNQYIVCLVFGVIFCEIGFLEESALVTAGVFSWLISGLLAYVFAGLSAVGPVELAKMLIPIVTLIVLGILGMFIMSMIVGRFFGFTKEMGFACALTALFGFPADYIITNEVCESVSKTENERLYVVDILLPRMLVGGFATVSIASVIIASIFINLL